MLIYLNFVRLGHQAIQNARYDVPVNLGGLFSWSTPPAADDGEMYQQDEEKQIKPFRREGWKG